MSETRPKRALGRGLSSLLDDISGEVNTGRESDRERTVEDGVQRLPIEQIVPNKDQPRKYFEESDLSDLAASIREKGVIQPILVRPARGRPGEYQIVAGERRWRAAQKARLHDVPVVVRELDDKESLEIAIVENVQRADLNAMEEAFGYRQLCDRHEYTQEALAKSLGKSRAHIANMMRLTNLPDEVQQLVRSGDLSAGHARAILSAQDPIALAKDVVKKNMTVRDAERAAKPEQQRTKRKGGFVANDADTRAIEQELGALLQMRVHIRQRGDKGGELAIVYRSADDLEELRGVLAGRLKEVFATS